MAKQRSISHWTAQIAQKRAEFSNPFQPTPEEIARAKESEFYTGGDYEGPDRPPTPTGVPMPAGYGSGSGYPGYGGVPAAQMYPPGGYQYQPQRPVIASSSSRVLMPRWTGSAWVYDEVANPSGKSGKKHGHSSHGDRHRDRSVDSSKPPPPTRSYTMPANAFYGVPTLSSPPATSPNNQPYPMYTSPPASGTTTPANASVTGYGYPPIIIESASSHKKKLKKKSTDGRSILQRL